MHDVGQTIFIFDRIVGMTQRPGLLPDVAMAMFEPVYMRRPAHEQQADPDSPYSMTSNKRGFVGKLLLASEVLAKTKAILRALELKDIREAIDRAYLQEYMTTGGGRTEAGLTSGARPAHTAARPSRARGKKRGHRKASLN